MSHADLAFTAVFLKVGQGYVGFIEELPQMTAQGATLDEARNRAREPFVIPLPRPEPKPDPSLTTSSAPRAYAAPNGSR